MDAFIVEAVADALREYGLVRSGMAIPWTCESEPEKALWIQHVHKAIAGEHVCNFTDLKDFQASLGTFALALCDDVFSIGPFWSSASAETRQPLVSFNIKAG